jgi:hypothetical protein
LQAATYSGSLTYTPGPPPDVNDELNVGPANLQWVNYTVAISWTVTDTDASYPGYPWKYTYTFGHNGGQAGISHIIIEGSEGMTVADLVGLSGASLYPTDPIGVHQVTSGNPNMPEDINGIKFNPLADSPFGMTWSFFSNRVPVWGDFYARCGGRQGGINFAYNYNLDAGGNASGFLSPDTDPAAAPESGTAANHCHFHILRPDSLIPEPTSLWVMELGLLTLLRRR